MGARVYGGPKWTVSPVYEGMLKEEMDAAAARHPDVEYQPVLIDATYAGLLTGATETPLVIPALNRDGDCLSDLVLPMFGSIAGAESVLLAFDDDYEVDVAMAEAPHGTAPSLMGKDLANPMAMLLACGAVLQLRRRPRASSGAERASRAIYEGVLETIGDRRRRRSTSAAHATTTRVHRRGDREGAHQGRDLVDRSALRVEPVLGRACGGGRAPAGRPSTSVPATTIAPRLSASWAMRAASSRRGRRRPRRRRCSRPPGSS